MSNELWILFFHPRLAEHRGVFGFGICQHCDIPWQPCTSIMDTSRKAVFTSLDDIFVDIYVRFLINLPEEEKSSFERLGFAIEQAFWFYEDFFREPNPKDLPKHNLKSFGSEIFRKFPSLLCPFDQNVQVLFDDFFEYKSRIPTYGAIILNDGSSKCLMVRGWSSKQSWGFPKGKISKNEQPHECAIREVIEETGYNISAQLDPDKYIEVTSKEHKTRLYVVLGVSENTPFAPLARKEIGSISWHPLSTLSKQSDSSRYYNVKPFIGRLFKLLKQLKSKESFPAAEAAALPSQEPFVIQQEKSKPSLQELQKGLRAFIKELMEAYPPPF